MTANAPAHDAAAIAEIAKGLTSIQRAAISGSIFVAGSWGLTTRYENHPEIMDDLSEDIADCVSGILTPLGLAVRAYLQETQNDAG